MHANFFMEVNNLGTKGQFIGVTCRAVALRGGGLALFAGCFVAQKRSRGVLSLTATPKTRHICPTFYLYKTVSANGAILILARRGEGWVFSSPRRACMKPAPLALTHIHGVLINCATGRLPPLGECLDFINC